MGVTSENTGQNESNRMVCGDRDPRENVRRATVFVYSYKKWFANSLRWCFSKTLGTPFEKRHCASLL